MIATRYQHCRQPPADSASRCGGRDNWRRKATADKSFRSSWLGTMDETGPKWNGTEGEGDFNLCPHVSILPQRRGPAVHTFLTTFGTFEKAIPARYKHLSDIEVAPWTTVNIMNKITLAQPGIDAVNRQLFDMLGMQYAFVRQPPPQDRGRVPLSSERR